MIFFRIDIICSAPVYAHISIFFVKFLNRILYILFFLEFMTKMCIYIYLYFFNYIYYFALSASYIYCEFNLRREIVCDSLNLAMIAK